MSHEVRQHCGHVRRILLALLISAAWTPPARACGGFFCQQVPIDQAGELIVFRVDGDQVTALVQIQYIGDADDFSWVVPVPGIPDLETGSDAMIQALESATRPQFLLERQGSPCDFDFDLNNGVSGPTGGNGADSAEDDGVTVLERSEVGPFLVQVVSSADAEAMARWLAENGYDLSDRGRDLIAPYVALGMNFVALRLRQDQGVGDIRPLVMRYRTSKPMIPIRLTAVAAQPDMGILTWILGDTRAVPLNYLHVDVNYTLVNWYAGSTAAYASYQGLVTLAMDEAGGHGFATDFAGRLPELPDQLPSLEAYTAEHARLAAVTEVATFFDVLAAGVVYPSDEVLEILRRQLPLPEGVDEFTYGSGALLADLFDAEVLAEAMAATLQEIQTGIIDPLSVSLALLDGDPYITRFYTTLSPEEMTLDPEFSFNADLPDQPLERQATLVSECGLGGSSWYLQLGAGTDRAGAIVLRGSGSPPFAAPTIDQPALSRSQRLSDSSAPEAVTVNEFAIDFIDNGSDGTCGSGIGGSAGVGLALLIGALVRTRARRQSGRRAA